MAQFPAGSPSQATTCGQSAPVTEVACEEEDWARDEALEGNRKKKQGQTCGSVLRRRLGQREGERRVREGGFRRVMEERGKCCRATGARFPS